MARHGDHGLDDGHVVAIARDVLDEGAVDLELVRRQPLEVAQGGVTGAEVIDGKADAKRLELAHLADGVFCVP